MSLVLRWIVCACVVLTAAWCYPADDSVTSPVVSGNDYRALFDRFEAAYAGASLDPDNARGQFAWLESYHMVAHTQMYRATGDTRYLRKMTERFERVLAARDDKLGRKDDYTSTALTGWGATSYNRGGAKWHVFIVHTGMILHGPAEFVRIVSQDAALADFRTSASAYAKVIDESIRGAEPYWHDGPGANEGYYSDPAFGMLPLNQSNALGCVLLDMYDVTSNTQYLDRATRLAHFFKNRLRTVENHYEWAYWPKETDDTTATEDISHAAINVDFAVHCAQRGIVFTREDIQRFARTWLETVRLPDGSHAERVGGSGKPDRYTPGPAGRWLVLCELLPPRMCGDVYADVARTFDGKPLDVPSKALGIANLLLYRNRSVPLDANP